MFHVLVGEEAAVEPVQRAAAERGAVSWIVPKAAKPEDEVVLFFPHIGFLGRGVVASEPEATMFGKRQTYRADVGNLILFAFPVVLDEIAKLFPEWAWTRYPRSFTTPPEELAGRVSENLLRLGTEAEPGAAPDPAT